MPFFNCILTERTEEDLELIVMTYNGIEKTDSEHYIGILGTNLVQM